MGLNYAMEKLGSQCHSFGIWLGGESSSITDIGITDFATGLQKRSAPFKKLSIHFDGCKQITNKGLESIAASLKTRMGSVRSLNITFDLCEQITNEGVFKVADAIDDGCQSLDEASFGFAYCFGVSSKSKSYIETIINEKLAAGKNAKKGKKGKLSDKTWVEESIDEIHEGTKYEFEKVNHKKEDECLIQKSL